MNITNYTKLWFELGDDDINSAKILLKDGGSPNSVCFHGQQVAEKYLKGFLTARKQEMRKIHDLKGLIELCKKLDEEFNQLENDAVYLNRFYVETRYADDFFSFKKSEAEQAIAAAERIKKFVLSKIK